jgi:hypothetical protein
MPPMKQPIWILVAVAAAVALAGCSKKSESSCAAAAAKAVASLRAGAEVNGVKEKLQAIYTTRCTEDKWPAEVISCYESATGMQGLTACREKLAPELGAKLRGEIMSAMAAAGVMMGGPPRGAPAGGAGATGPGSPPAAGAPGAPGAPSMPDGSAAAPPK